MSLSSLEVFSALGQIGLTLASSSMVLAFSTTATGTLALGTCILKNELIEGVLTKQPLSFYFYLGFSDRHSCTDVSWDSWLMRMEFKFETDSFILCQTLHMQIVFCICELCIDIAACCRRIISRLKYLPPTTLI